ncbi:MAG: 1-acyl-sn-glycerol-3-phosphate acyltransferase [Deltaproteobacteria bacterium]|nr:1-acyl-sn-glycerol-3-phosphate acyltransferase [Deltaproteobacteria bacterium]
MLYGLKLVALGAVTLPATLLTVIFGLFDAHGKYAYLISRFWSWLILAIGGVSLRVSGLNHIDPRRQYIFMVNHQSNLDIPVLFQGLPGFQLRWLAKKEILWVPFLGWAVWAARHIAVDRGDRKDALKSLKKAKERMAGGISIVFFPEGTRSSDGGLLPFKRGGFLLAVKTQTPIVPVTINGSGKILAKGDWRLRGGEIQVTVGMPVSVEDYRPGNLRALSARVRDLIAANLVQAEETTERKNYKAEPAVENHSSLKKRAV